jgi:hypothetical protein
MAQIEREFWKKGTLSKAPDDTITLTLNNGGNNKSQLSIKTPISTVSGAKTQYSRVSDGSGGQQGARRAQSLIKKGWYSSHNKRNVDDV